MINTRAGNFCSSKCILDYAKTPKAKNKVAKAKKQEAFKEKQERLYWDLPHQLKLTKNACNKFIRTLDKGQPCISCGRPVCGRNMEAGHFKSVGSHPELRFDPRNIYLQGSGCNQANSKRKKNNLTVAKEYRERLIEKMGQAMVDWLEGPHKPRHYSCDELRELRTIFIDETKRLESGQSPSREWRKLP